MYLNMKSYNILLSAFLCYNRFYVQTKVNIIHMRNSYPIFNIICEYIDMFIQVIYATVHWLTHSRTEPSDPAWICICKYVSKTLISNNEIDEEYFRFDKNVLHNWPTRASDFLNTKNEQPAESIWDVYHSKYQDVFEITKCGGCIYDTLVIARACPTAVRICILENMKPGEDLLELKLSESKFVEVEFRCGDGSGISIDIPTSHYIVGNDILSKTDILRYLEHHLPNYSRWEFDEFSYSVRIMESDFNVFSISGEQYIRITESGHEIIKNSEN